MRDGIEQCVLNCIACRSGTYPLYRGFGLNAVDQVGRLRRSQVVEQIEMFYPDLRNVKVTQLNETEYKITVQGFSNEIK